MTDEEIAKTVTDVLDSFGAEDVSTESAVRVIRAACEALEARGLTSTAATRYALMVIQTNESMKLHSYFGAMRR